MAKQVGGTAVTGGEDMSESGRRRGQVGLEATVRHSVILRDENPLWGFGPAVKGSDLRL